MKAITSAKNGDGEALYTVDEGRVEVVSSVITADEFFDLLTEATEEFSLGPGKHAVIRSLSYPEVKRIVKENQGNKDEMELSALIVGTVHPKFTREHLQMLRRAERAGPIFFMAKRIMQISGMMDDDKSLGEDGASS